MKKCLKTIKYLAVLCLCLGGLFAGCAQNEPQTENENAIAVYYINKEETRITPLDHTLEEEDMEAQVAFAIGALQENPVEQSLRTVLNGYEILSWQASDSLLTLNLSDGYGKIPPTTEVLVRAALVRTFTQIKGIDHVAINVNEVALTDSLGITVGPMTADMFIDNAGNEINANEKVRLKLYFSNETGDRLVAITTQPMVYNSNISLEKLVIEQLIKGPEEGTEDVWPVINPEAKLVSVSVKDGTCYVNLNEAFLTQVYNVSGEVVLYSIINSLVELSNINKVQFFINGENKVIFRETINLENSFERNLDLVYGNEEGS